MARPGRPGRNRAARSFRQLRRFHHVINSDKVLGIHTKFGMVIVSWPDFLGGRTNPAYQSFSCRSRDRPCPRKLGPCHCGGRRKCTGGAAAAVTPPVRPIASADLVDFAGYGFVSVATALLT